jgi:hypothetical protein
LVSKPGFITGFCPHPVDPPRATLAELGFKDYTLRMITNRSSFLLKVMPWLQAIVTFLFASLLFALAYAQSPLYTSNQNQYFLHGLAQAGYGNLQQDWLANTLDPTPLFSALVAWTYHLTHIEAVFYGIYAILMGIYLFSLAGIVTMVFDLRHKLGSYWAFLALIFLVHSAGWRFMLSHLLGTNWGYILEDGLAGQRMLGPVLEPSCFAVFLMLSIDLFMMRRPVLAVISACLAASFHPTYLLSAACLTLAYTLAIALESWQRLRQPTQTGETRPTWLIRSLGTGLVGLIAIAPILYYVVNNFGNTPAETTAQARAILINYRIPHHALVSQWFDATALVKIGLFIAALVVLRRGRLLVVMLVCGLAAAGLTVIQVLSGNQLLALIFPWRLSIFLLPLATALLSGALVSFFFNHWAEWAERHTRAVRFTSLGLIVLTILVGGVRFALDLQRKNQGPERAMELYIASHYRPHDVYLTPIKMQDFRLATGAPVYVDFKSIPYRDKDVLEWYRRVRLADRFYNQIDCGLLPEFIQAGVTQIVIERGQLNNPPCLGIQPVYQNETYQIYPLSAAK